MEKHGRGLIPRLTNKDYRDAQEIIDKTNLFVINARNPFQVNYSVAEEPILVPKLANHMFLLSTRKGLPTFVPKLILCFLFIFGGKLTNFIEIFKLLFKICDFF